MSFLRRRGNHTPDADGPPAHNLLEDGEWTAPPDVLVHPDRYTGFRREVSSFWPLILKAQGRPSAKIRIYRALPTKHSTFRTGDWVTPSLAYAKMHIRSGNVQGEAHIIEALVPARTIRWAGDDLVEWGYFGSTVKGDVVLSPVNRVALRYLKARLNN